MKLPPSAVALLLAAAFLPACKKHEPPAAPPVPVSVTPVLRQNVIASQQWVGLLDGFQNANIQAQVTGYLLTQNYQEGSFVKKGDTLFTIDPRPFQAALAQAQAQYASAVAKAQLEQLTLQKQTQLYETKVISEQQYQTSYQNTQASIADVAAAQAAVQSAQVNLDYCTINAPFDGIAGVAQAQIGDLVGPGGRVSILTQASQIDPMKLNFFITESEFLQAFSLIERISKIPASDRTARLSIKLADGTQYPEPGTYDFVNRQINSSTGTIQVTGLFPNPNGILRPGLFAAVTAPVQQIDNAILVPQKSLVELQGAHFISIALPDGTAKPIPVKPGPLQGQWLVVDGPVPDGAKVIVEGVEKARPGMKLDAKPWQGPPPPPPAGQTAAPASTPAAPAAS
ncbi:MAG: efflux RND transporter periplasmic adaptor subunit [Verrucomicrobia bacterium]|nr:efflux RND transporter periplasmic adaptor subunit [Verrucomicrobiota bacterium]